MTLRRRQKGKFRECWRELNPSYLNTNINFYIHLDRQHESSKAQLKSIKFLESQLPIRPIVSNLNTATYQLAKHFSKILPPSKGFQMVSFDVKSLFTNVSLETTMDIIFRRIYTSHELTTSLTKKEMKELFLLCIKNVYFAFNGQIYIQVDGIAMGSPLPPLLADIFLIELERSLIPNLRKVKFWRHYVDDTTCFIKIGLIEYIEKIYVE